MLILPLLSLSLLPLSQSIPQPKAQLPFPDTVSLPTPEYRGTELLPPSVREEIHALLSSTSFAEGKEEDHLARLLEKYDPTFDHSEQRFVKVFEEGEPRWMTELDKLGLRRVGKGFMDLTGREEVDVDLKKGGNQTWPDISHQTQVRSTFPHLTTHSMKHGLTTLSSFYSRYYRSENGRESSEWLYNEVLKIIASAPPGLHLSLESIPHHFPQSSLIARFTPSPTPYPSKTPMQPKPNQTLPLQDLPTVVVGAHQDSANYLFPLLPAPGADDDGSGTITLLESFKALVERGYSPRDKVVEFHWYAAEEAGLLGSLDIVGLMRKRKIVVDAMMEFDMTAFVKKGTQPTINIISTDADPNLSDWIVKVAEEYCDEPVKRSELFPGAGSDYMSFTNAGFSAAFATEADPMAGLFDPYVHTVADRMDLADQEFSFEHMLEFSKLAIGFVVEQAGWKLD